MYKSFDELLRYTDIEENYPDIKSLIEEFKDQETAHHEQYVDKQLESIREQVSFARELIDQVEYILKHTSRFKEAKERILEAIQESYFER